MRDDRFMENGIRAEDVWKWIDQSITQAVEEAVEEERRRLDRIGYDPLRPWKTNDLR